MRQLVALSLMQQQSASERLRGVSWAYQAEPSDREVLGALVKAVNHDPNVNVRLAAVDALKKFGQHQVVQRGVLQALSQQDSPIVQVALIDWVVDLKDTDSVGTLQKLTKDTSANDEVRKHAEWGIEQLQPAEGTAK